MQNHIHHVHLCAKGMATAFVSAVTSSALLMVLVGTTSACLDPDLAGNLVPKTVDEDPSLPALEINETRVYYETHGNPNDPVIVFLHGGPGSNFYEFQRMDALADAGYYLVYWDQRGSGLSRRHGEGAFSFQGLIDDLDALINVVTAESSTEQVTLVGQSWGGQYAALYISERPERVSSVVMIEPGPFTGALLDDKMDDIVHVDLFDGSLNELLWAGEVVQADSHERADYLRMLGALSGSQPDFHCSESDPSHGWRVGAVAHDAIIALGEGDDGFDFDFTTGLHHFEKAALFIKGAWNEVYDIPYYEAQMEAFPSAELEIVEGAGHDAVWVKAAEVRQLILDHLDEMGI